MEKSFKRIGTQLEQGTKLFADARLLGAELCAQENMFVDPTPETVKFYADLVMTSEITLAEITEKLNKLAVLYEMAEDAQAKITQFKCNIPANTDAADNGLPIEDSVEVAAAIQDLKEARELIEADKKTNGPYYNLFFVLWSEIQKRNMDTLDQFYKKTVPTTKVEVHEKIYVGVSRELAVLQVRVQNLKYQYAKRDANAEWKREL